MPHAPGRMPRPQAREVKKPEAEQVLSPLALYFRLNQISTEAFCRASGFDVKTVMGLLKGQIMPTLPTAFEIERLTKGAVPMEAWLGLPQAKAHLARLAEKQPEGVRGFRPAKPGGFAAPERGVSKDRQPVEDHGEAPAEQEDEPAQEEEIGGGDDEKDDLETGG